MQYSIYLSTKYLIDKDVHRKIFLGVINIITHIHTNYELKVIYYV